MRRLVLTLTTCAAAVSAHAQQMDLQHHQPAVTPNGLGAVKSGAAEGSGFQTLGLFAIYGHDPLVVVDAQGRRVASLVSDRLDLVLAYAIGLDLAANGALGLFRGVDFVASLPYVPLSRGSRVDDALIGEQPSSAGGFGDPRLEARLGVLSRDRFGVDVALIPVVSLPLARGAGYLGNGSVAFTPELAVSTGVGPVWLGANLGYRVRVNEVVLRREIADQLLWRAGVGLDLGRLGLAKDLEAGVEAFGLTKSAAPFRDVRDSPVEVLAGARYRVADVIIDLRGGTGLNTGYGTPSARVTLGVAWAPRVLDADRDGIADEVDRCPQVPEDADAFEDGDGCPDPDNDGDALLDEADACPDVAEDKDGFADDDGCPDLDNDGDALADAADKCPNVAEDMDGFADDDGCPDPDNDGDTLADTADKCPNDAEDKDGYQDFDGCPDPDNDGDGFADARDKCPLLAEDKNGYRDDDGCPDARDDKDGDGLGDKVDACPTEPEDKDSFADEDGCPDLDNDRDGVADAKDACPNEPEDGDGFMDKDGCPEEDNDGDGLVDGQDKCPNDAEVINGVDDGDGCPDEGAQLVELTATEIEIKETVQFETGSDVIRAESFGLLDQVAAVLRNHAEISLARVEGHTDDRGGEQLNLELSQKRAASVRRYLMEKGGIGGERLESVGYGEQRPIASNRSERGRAMNRRVEFTVVAKTKAASPAPVPAASPAKPPPAPVAPGTPAASVAPAPGAAAQPAATAADADVVIVTLKQPRTLAALSAALWGSDVHAQLLLERNPAAGAVTAPLASGTAVQIPRRTTYTIKKGDTLGVVAKRLLGSTKAYTLIVDASKATVPDPSKIDVGTVVTVPLVTAEVEKKLAALR